MEEIKSQDLMINNWVEYDDKWYKIAALTEEYPFLNTDAFGVGVVTYRNIRGIPLTEDILLKCGAKRIEENKVSIMLNNPSTHLILMKIGTHWFPQIEQTGEFASDGVNTVCLNFIDYIHELQNLVKCLTKTELTVEL